MAAWCAFAAPIRNVHAMTDGYPVQLDVEYPDRELNRLTTFFRAFTIIPIAIVLATVSGRRGLELDATTAARATATTTVVVAGGILVAGPLLMILFRAEVPALVVRLESRADALLLARRGLRRPAG